MIDPQFAADAGLAPPKKTYPSGAAAAAAGAAHPSLAEAQARMKEAMTMPDSERVAQADIAAVPPSQRAAIPDMSAPQTVSKIDPQFEADSAPSKLLDTGAGGGRGTMPASAYARTDTARFTSEPTGAWAAVGAGAGKAFGQAALAIQQVAGYGIQQAGKLTGSPTIQQAGDWLYNDASTGARNLEAQNAPYEQAHPVANIAGQAGGLTAAVAMTPLSRAVPMSGAAPSAGLLGAAGTGAVQGSVLNALTSPVIDPGEPFVLQKVKQAIVGAGGGAVGGVLGYGISSALNSAISGVKSMVTKLTANDADAIVSRAMAEAGTDAQKVSPDLYDGLKKIVQQSVESGKPVDSQATTRLVRAQTLPVPVPMLNGQITRDPMQFAMEQNLRGIAGVGEPITNTLAAQNKALVANLDALGARQGQDIVTAAPPILQTLQQADAAAQRGVGRAYKAFKDSTGKTLDVPLQGLAQDYAKVLGDYGEVIPGAIRGKFEGLGLLKGTQQKTFSIDDAENLIKVINKNYDPSMKAQASALNELRQSVQNAIVNGAGGSVEGAEAANLARQARQAAAARFATLDQTPALRAAVSGVEPDKFIQKYVLQGNQSEIVNMMGMLQKTNPDAVGPLQDSVMAHIKNKAAPALSADNAVLGQATLRNFVNDPNMAARMKTVLGPDKFGTLRQLAEVAEDAKYAPAAAAVNYSNTAGAAANLVRGTVQGGPLNAVLSGAKMVPGFSAAAGAAQQSLQSSRAANLVNQAVSPSVGKAARQIPLPNIEQFGAKAGALGAGNERNRPQQ
jgi:hypothetical protein